MNQQDHDRARKLLSQARVEGVSSDNKKWLDAHLTACADCTKEAAALNAAIGELRVMSISAGPAAARRASLAVQLRAQQLRAERERTVSLFIAAATSVAWTVVGTPLAWSAFAWFGRVLHVSDVVWQFGFLMWWFLPATITGTIAAWKHKGGQLKWERL